jgi:hypothetical protein
VDFDFASLSESNPNLSIGFFPSFFDVGGDFIIGYLISLGLDLMLVTSSSSNPPDSS